MPIDARERIRLSRFNDRVTFFRHLLIKGLEVIKASPEMANCATKLVRLRIMPSSRTPGQPWRQEYDNDGSVIYLLDRELRVVMCNAAWDKFAAANGGKNCLAQKVIGTEIWMVIPPVLQGFYRAAYENVRQHKRDWWHVFPCSSPGVSRTFHMRILHCADDYLLTINTLIGEKDAEKAAEHRLPSYMDSDGIITSCAHCRRVQRLHSPRLWDWVPEVLINGTALVKFDLCGFCYAYHYPTV